MTNEEMKKGAWICVLNDGETYTGLDGCWFASTPQDELELLDEGEHEAKDVPGPHYSLQALLWWAIDHGYFDKQKEEAA